MRTRPIIFFCILLSMVLVNAAKAQDDRIRKFFAVQEMVGMVRQNEQILFTVMLKRYFIEGVPYPATMLKVSPGHTFDIEQINDGFTAFVLFPKNIVHQAARKNEIRDGVVKVSLKVLLDDIYMIVGHKKSGEQINLYQ